ncbi:MAG: YggS family pyridoxal phosphate-dependent enzyme [Nitrospiria bacterium]
MAIKDNLAQIQRNLSKAAVKSGRSVAGINLIGVTKTIGMDRVIEAIQEGVKIFGENRVQEALPKMESVGSKGYHPEWHFIGKLQRNKVKSIVGSFSLIHSVDSIPLAEEIARRSEIKGIPQEILLEINLSGESAKSGLSVPEVLASVNRINSLKYVKLIGLMTIPPLFTNPEDSRPYFKRLKELGGMIEEQTGNKLGSYSMGMSNDYEIAVEEGATHIRIGRALFGERVI